MILHDAGAKDRAVEILMVKYESRRCVERERDSTGRRDGENATNRRHGHSVFSYNLDPSGLASGDEIRR